MINSYDSPLFIIWNVDENNNKISELMQPENHVVINGKVVLHQLPDKFHRVTINGKVEIQDFSTPIDASNKFRVDYSNGIVFLHESLEGQTITVDRYYGRGIIMYPASRIYTEIDSNNNVVETLGSLITDGYEALKALGTIDDAIAIATAREISLEADIATATNLEILLENKIVVANDINTALGITIISANEISTILGGNIVDGQNKIQEITDKIIEADNKIAETESARLSIIDTENRFEVFEQYNPLASYKPLNKVVYNSDIYVCKVACMGIDPTNSAYWLKIMADVTRVQISTVNGNIIVDGVETLVYQHPNTHSANEIVPTTEKQFVSQAEKDIWNEKQDDLGFTPEDNANKGQANGYAPLDANGQVPAVHLPDSVKAMTVVQTIAERDLLSTYEGMRVHVVDASADETVTSGWAEYLFMDSQWAKMAEVESLDVITDWSNITNKPTSTIQEIDQSVSDSHTHDNKNTLDLITAPFTVELEQKLNEVGTAIVSEVEPTENLKDGVMWYKPSLKETKVYLDGQFRAIGGSDTVTVSLTNTIVIESDTTTIPIGMANFRADKDVLFVFQNTTHLQKDIDYSISEDGLNLINISDKWYSGQVIDLVAIVSANGNPDIFYSEILKSEYIATTDGESLNIPINQPLYNPDYDELSVYHENLKLFEDDNYTLDKINKTISLIGYTLNTENKVKFEVVKKMRSVGNQIDGLLLKDNSVGYEKLSNEVQNMITNIEIAQIYNVRW